jgi:hypothetical protein
MPVATGRSGGSRQLLVLAFATFAAFAAMYFLFSRAGELAGSGDVDVNLGSDVFEAGNVERLSADIEEKGPLLMPDLISDRDRDIYLQHIGDEPNEGWHAFAARPLDASRDCFVEWKADESTFVDVCDETVYDAVGSGLTTYPVLIDQDGNLAVDINAADRPEPLENETESLRVDTPDVSTPETNAPETNTAGGDR